jgi:hypothetical protein
MGGLIFASTPALSAVVPTSTPISNQGWRLWLDTQASWQNDKLYLPDDVDLSQLPANPPTGGWSQLSDNAGIGVSLPGTVEEHYWGRAPAHALDPANPKDVVGGNGTYTGVSWWYRSFLPPALKRGERLIFTFPGARLRAEVYVNGVLVGYNMVGETQFDADATSAIKPGRPNILAIRITNPGGTLSWGDFGLVSWGGYSFPETHGFGGLDGGIAMSVTAPIAVDDLFVANTPNPHTVTLNADLVSTGGEYDGPMTFTISRAGKEVWNGKDTVHISAGRHATISERASVPSAHLWAVGQPNLYTASARIDSIDHSDRSVAFGFRWFNADGIGTNPRLTLNGKRIFVSSAISWGYWAQNGMFPDAEAAARDVDAVRALGMNCVQNHRHYPKPAELDAFDHAGLMIYCEPGGGSAVWDETQPHPRTSAPIDASGTGGDPVSFANRYESAKLLAMVKTYRSHPSVIMWSLNNESGADIHNPKMFYAMRLAHRLDPSRIVVLKSGFGPQGEIMGRPYSDTLYYGDDATHHDSGWHDNHNEDDRGVYQDSLYKNPTDYKCYSTDKTGIAMWGELGTANSPDDFTKTVNWYRKNDVHGYNRSAAEAQQKAYDAFLDKYQFRSDYPTAEKLFQEVGARHYFAASHIIENARISDANDYIALTGWESTTVDNNSGLVDALRQLKADPTLVKQANAPAVIILKARHYVVAKGSDAVVDAFIANEVNYQGAYTLHFSAALDTSPSRPFYKANFPVHVTGGETFGELLKDNISFRMPSAGPVTLRAFLTSAPSPDALLLRKEPMLVVDTNPQPLVGTIAAADLDGKLIPAIKRQFNVSAVPLSRAPANIDTIVACSSESARSAWTARAMQNVANVQGTDDPGLYAQQYGGVTGTALRYSGLAPGSATVELFFAEPYFSQPGQRVFDVAINGLVVLKRFDIVAESGGKAVAVVKKFTVDCTYGTLELSFPAIEHDLPTIAAIRVTDAQGKIIREVFRRDDYRDVNGTQWKSASLLGFDWAKFLPTVLDRVRSGSRLVLMGMDARDIGEAAKVLQGDNILQYGGDVGYDDTPWIGHWYFSRKHWLLDGLPSGCVLDWQYQEASSGDGFAIDAPGIQPVIAYGKNPGPALGLAAAVIPVGHGQIVLLALPGLNAAFEQGDPDGFQPVSAARIVYNALSHSVAVGP